MSAWPFDFLASWYFNLTIVDDVIKPSMPVIRHSPERDSTTSEVIASNFDQLEQNSVPGGSVTCSPRQHSTPTRTENESSLKSVHNLKSLNVILHRLDPKDHTLPASTDRGKSNEQDESATSSKAPVKRRRITYAEHKALVRKRQEAEQAKLEDGEIPDSDDEVSIVNIVPKEESKKITAKKVRNGISQSKR